MIFTEGSRQKQKMLFEKKKKKKTRMYADKEF